MLQILYNPTFNASLLKIIPSAILTEGGYFAATSVRQKRVSKKISGQYYRRKVLVAAKGVENGLCFGLQITTMLHHSHKNTVTDFSCIPKTPQ